METVYTAEALATGAGRDGHVRSLDGLLDVEVAVPQEMGGQGGATNPEQLFAAGYAACFHSALHVVARREKADVNGSEVSAKVGVGPNGEGGYQLEVSLHVCVPNVDQATAESLTEAAHKVCPYSNATRGNIDVTLSSTGSAA